jgi:hypothetical protein
MHLRVISVKRGDLKYNYAQIVERYKENGKAKNQGYKAPWTSNER